MRNELYLYLFGIYVKQKYKSAQKRKNNVFPWWDELLLWVRKIFSSMLNLRFWQAISHNIK